MITTIIMIAFSIEVGLIIREWGLSSSGRSDAPKLGAIDQKKGTFQSVKGLGLSLHPKP